MTALVILGCMALVVFALWQKWRALPQQTKQLWGAIFGMAGAYKQMKKQQNNAPPASGSLMLACHKCGLHVLENEGVCVRGQFYCSAEHSA